MARGIKKSTKIDMPLNNETEIVIEYLTIERHNV